MAGTKLLPCPFCGGEAEAHEVMFPYHYWDVLCDGECFDHFCEKPTKAEAIAAWNTRAETVFVTGTTTVTDTPQITYVPERTCKMETDHDELEVIAYSHEDTWAYKCNACGWSFRYDRGIKPNYCPNCGARVIA